MLPRRFAGIAASCYLTSVEMLALLLAGATAFDAVTYTSPAGFSVKTGTSVAMMRDACAIELFESVTKSGDLAAVFTHEWSARVASGTTLAGAPQRQMLASGLVSLSGIGQGADGIAVLTVVDGGKRAVSVLMRSPTPQSIAACQQAYASLVGSLSFAAPAASAPAGPARSGVGPPALGPVPEGLRTSDLAGKWVPRTATAFQTAYYSRSSGAFTGSDASVGLESWTFDAKGNFTFRESGLTHGQSYDRTESGTAEIAEGVLILRGDAHDRKYRVLGYENRPDATLLRVLPDWADPRRQVDLDTYGQYLVRAK